MPNQRSQYAYRYRMTGTEIPLQWCPSCGHDLTQDEAGVTVVLYDRSPVG
jgi:hypothetical protein